MKKSIVRICLAGAVALLSVTSARAAMYDLRSAWEAAAGDWVAVQESWAVVNPDDGISTVPFLASQSLGLNAGNSLGFSVDLEGGKVALNWGSPPDPDNGIPGSTWPDSGWLGNPHTTPPVLITPFGLSSLTGTFNSRMNSFGFDVDLSVTDGDYWLQLTLEDGSIVSEPIVVSGTGPDRVRFLGWANQPVIDFTITAPADAGGFAFGRMVEGPGSGGGTPGVPEGGSLFLISGLLWTGLLGWRQWRNRA